MRRRRIGKRNDTDSPDQKHFTAHCTTTSEEEEEEEEEASPPPASTQDSVPCVHQNSGTNMFAMWMIAMQEIHGESEPRVNGKQN
ncbi:hypothetical protein MUK42_10099 [Musa troglodytarum]|uniref:Uncharacterized protein n=1 Tax=Musa troglodytarum TaxID=320322 RepID=A0A9E7FI48_9LILI|nr:hypothetical protein MUK42_10099 [Musa troglodytarum]